MLIIYSTDSRLYMCEVHKRLRVVVSSGRSIHKIWRGKCGGNIANTEMKLSLNVPINFYASLLWCMFDGMSQSSSLFLSKYYMTIEGH